VFYSIKSSIIFSPNKRSNSKLPQAIFNSFIMHCCDKFADTVTVSCTTIQGSLPAAINKISALVNGGFSIIPGCGGYFMIVHLANRPWRAVSTSRCGTTGHFTCSGKAGYLSFILSSSPVLLIVYIFLSLLPFTGQRKERIMAQPLGFEI